MLLLFLQCLLCLGLLSGSNYVLCREVAASEALASDTVEAATLGPLGDDQVILPEIAPLITGKNFGDIALLELLFTPSLVLVLQPWRSPPGPCRGL